ncbi:MAG: DMT family transporter [Nitrososphaerota archaeon]|jgi:drug/metabolite transporter (DMT)-like permease|nr:DMT family transporter [Nitrososphaerota archaeon]MDG6932948.1 DMT family transporter [Nitrososphaerota archaeon]MDG6935759.1 DMT family transporter [Nitrososphaerota archaeon]MDG6944163.1 DMT family transporter [Nitrososphaerota archaeon]
MKIRTKAFLYLSLNVLGLGFWPIALRVGALAMDAVSFLLLSFASAALVSFAYLLATDSLASLKNVLADRRNAAVISFAGLLNYGIAAILVTYGSVQVSASLASVLYRSWVLLMIPFIPLILKTRVNRYQLAGLGIGFIAMYFASTEGTVIRVNLGQLPAIIALIAAGFAAAISNLLIKSRNAPIFVQLFIFNASALTFFVILLPIMHGFGYSVIFNPSLPAIASVLFVSLVTYFAGAYFFFYALKTIGPTITGNAMLIVPFLTFLFAFILIKEPVYPYYIVLAALVATGVIVQERAPGEAPEVLSPKGRRSLFDVSGAFTEARGEVAEMIKGEGRALAVRIDREGLSEEDEALVKRTAGKYGCIAFSIDRPAKDITGEEVEFLKQILKDKGTGTFIIAIGKAQNAAAALREIYNALSNRII